MKNKFFFLAVILFVLFAFSSCNKKKDDIGDNCSGLWASELQNEINDWSNAAAAYGSNPTTENCNAYKSAAQAYLNALRPYGDCATLTGTQRTQWEQAIGEAQANVSNIEC